MKSLLLAVLVFASLMPSVHAGDLEVTIVPEYGMSQTLTRESSSPKEWGDPVSFATDFKQVSAGLSVSVRDDQWGVRASTTYATIKSFQDRYVDGSFTDLQLGAPETDGSTMTMEVSGQHYLTEGFRMDVGCHFTRVDQHTNDSVPVFDGEGQYLQQSSDTFSLRSTYIGPLLGMGVGREYGRVAVQADGAWYPWLHKTTTYRSFSGGSSDPATREGISGNGFSLRALIRMRVSESFGVRVSWHYRRLNDEGSNRYSDIRIPQHLTSSGTSIGFLFHL